MNNTTDFNRMAKKAYTKPEIEMLNGEDADILCVSTLEVKGKDFDEGSMTSLSRRASFYGDDEFEEE